MRVERAVDEVRAIRGRPYDDTGREHGVAHNLQQRALRDAVVQGRANRTLCSSQPDLFLTVRYVAVYPYSLCRRILRHKLTRVLCSAGQTPSVFRDTTGCIVLKNRALV
jgi:hypothetical protein